VVQAGTTLAVMEVEPWVLPTGAGAEVGRKPTTTAADEAGRWGRGGSPTSTWEEHYRTELPQPSSPLLPCGRGSHRPL
jgi:hypothetical protein